MKNLFAIIGTALFCAAAGAQTAPRVIPLWGNGAPGFESRKNIPEEAQDYWVRNINNPSITVLPSTQRKGDRFGCRDRARRRIS